MFQCLVWRLRWTLVSTGMSSMFARHVSFGSASWDWVHHSLESDLVKMVVHVYHVMLRQQQLGSGLGAQEGRWSVESVKCCCTSDLGVGKYDHGLSQLLQEDVLWLDVPWQVQYKLDVTIRLCRWSSAATYLADYCIPVSHIASRHHVWSAVVYWLTVPRVCQSRFG